MLQRGSTSLLVVGYWVLVVASWFLVIGFWLVESGGTIVLHSLFGKDELSCAWLLLCSFVMGSLLLRV